MIDKRKTDTLGISVNNDLSPVEVYFEGELDPVVQISKVLFQERLQKGGLELLQQQSRLYEVMGWQKVVNQANRGNLSLMHQCMFEESECRQDFSWISPMKDLLEFY